MNHQDEFVKWLYNQNLMICNGDMLVMAMENTTLQEQFLEDAGLPVDTDLNYE